MPNWCNNILTVSGPPERMKIFDEAFKGRPPFWPLQEAELSRLSNEEKLIAEQQNLEQWKKIKPTYRLNALYPVPDEVLKVGYSAPYDESKTLSEKISALYEPTEWYDGHSWCVSHWSTKWDIDLTYDFVDVNEGSFQIEFDTAWSPPLEWLKKVALDWPDFEFCLQYHEPGAMYAGNAFAANDVFEEEYEDSEEKYRELVLNMFGYDPCEDDLYLA